MLEVNKRLQRVVMIAKHLADQVNSKIGGYDHCSVKQILYGCLPFFRPIMFLEN